SGLGGTNQLSIYGEAMLSTFTQYDFNKDGIVDMSGSGADAAFFQSCVSDPTGAGCAAADINQDGYVTTSDMNLINNADWAWTSTSATLADMERIFWNGLLQSEAGIINVCQGAVNLVLTCAAADLNKDGFVN